jgi:hypothetical protein
MTERRQRLHLVPCNIERADEITRSWHRHHIPARYSFFRLAVADETGLVRGVCVVGHPVSRHLADGKTVEVLRVATDGCPNACSFLLGGARKVAFGMGYRRIITYTMPAEGGASLRGAGWKQTGQTRGETWDRPNRPRIDKHPVGVKLRWEAEKTGEIVETVWPETETETKQLVFFA